MDVTGNAGDAVNDRITVTGKDDANRNVSDFAEATVNIVNVNPAIDVQKTVKSTGSFAESASLPEPGGAFTYQVVVTNTSSASSDPLDITSLTDDIYHDITTTGHDGITATTCAVPQNDIPQNGTYTCTFTATFTGNAGAAETDTVTATGKDDEGNKVSDTDTAHVSLTDVPSSIDGHQDAVADERPRAGRTGDVLGHRDEHVDGRRGHADRRVLHGQGRCRVGRSGDGRLQRRYRR